MKRIVLIDECYPINTRNQRIIDSLASAYGEDAQLEVIMDVSFSEKGEIVVEHSVFNKSKEAVKLSIYPETPFSISAEAVAMTS